MTFIEIFAVGSFAILVIAVALIMTQPVDQSTIAFRDIIPGTVFYDDGQAYKKLEDREGCDNAQCLGETRHTRRYEGTDRIPMAVRMPLVWWRRWLIHRSLVWQVHGSPRRAAIAWRIARMWSNEKTEMALAAHATRLLMLGD